MPETKPTKEQLLQTKLLIDVDMQRAHSYVCKLAEELEISYEGLMNYAERAVESRASSSWGDYFCHPTDSGKWEGMNIPDEFWNHYQLLVEVEVPEEHRGSFLSCSC